MAKTVLYAPHTNSGEYEGVKVSGSGSYGRKRLELVFKQMGGVPENKITVRYVVSADKGSVSEGPFDFSQSLSKSHIVSGSVKSVSVMARSSEPVSRFIAKVEVRAFLYDA